MAARILDTASLNIDLRTVAYSFLVLLAAHHVFRTVLSWQRLRHFPGPPLASVSYLWLARAAVSGRAWQYQQDVRARYSARFRRRRHPSSPSKSFNPGPFVRIAPDMLIHDSPSVHRQINAARAGYVKGDWYAQMAIDPYVHSMFSTRDGAYHDDAKARTAAGYSGREVPSLEADLDVQVVTLKGLIRGKYLSLPGEATKPCDMARLAQFFTLDSLTKVAYGEEFGFLRTDGDVHGYIKTVEDYGPLFTLCADVPWIGRILASNLMLRLFGPKHTDKEGLGKMMGVARAVVSERFGPSAISKQDMLGSFVRHGLPRRQIEAEVLLQIVAGSDTTANVIRVGLLYLAASPAVYAKLQREIDDSVANGIIPSSADAVVSHAAARGLPYLQAIIYEAIRVHPPLSTLLPKIVPPGGDTFEDDTLPEGPGGDRPKVFVPGGTRIAVSPFGMMRHVEMFGEDVDVFRPERFMDAGNEQRRIEMERAVELVFGFGRFMCAGKTVAFTELNKIFVELLREFDFQLINPSKPWVELHYHLFNITDMWMRVTPRS